jgi:hypothetical protein
LPASQRRQVAMAALLSGCDLVANEQIRAEAGKGVSASSTA